MAKTPTNKPRGPQTQEIPVAKARATEKPLAGKVNVPVSMDAMPEDLQVVEGTAKFVGWGTTKAGKHVVMYLETDGRSITHLEVVKNEALSAAGAADALRVALVHNFLAPQLKDQTNFFG